MKLVILVGALFITSLSFTAKTIEPKPNNNDVIANIILKNKEVSSILEKEVTNYTIKDNTTDSAKIKVREEIIEFAQKKIGSPYVWGATGPNSFDCSGFVGYVFKSVAHLDLPRVSSAQATFKPRISSMNMTKGDLVFFETTGKGRISHVGIYMGNRQFIHASSGKSKRVMISSLDSSYYKKAFRWAINPFAQ